MNEWKNKRTPDERINERKKKYAIDCNTVNSFLTDTSAWRTPMVGPCRFSVILITVTKIPIRRTPL